MSTSQAESEHDNEVAINDSLQLLTEPTIPHQKLCGFQFYKQVLRSPRYIVAPMVDQSELSWRLLCRRHGAHLCYTPMLHAAVFLQQEAYRTQALDGSGPEDRPLIVQFCANDPEILVSASKLAQDNCDAVDLNLGCPQSIARRGNYGAYLQDNWSLVFNLVNRCHKELRVPVTAKIRVFSELQRTLDYAKMLESAGAQVLTVHGRTREQRGVDTGLADWSIIKAVREVVSIPVIANGNIETVEDVERCIKETGVSGVMTAEGNLHNPFMFEGRSPPIWEPAEEYLNLVREHPEPLGYVRAHLFKLFQQAMFRHTDIREILGSTRSLDIMSDCVAELRKRCEQQILSGVEHIHTEGLSVPYWICQPYRRPHKPSGDGGDQLPSEGDNKRRTAAQAALEGSAVAQQIIEERKRRKLEKQKKRAALSNVHTTTYPSCRTCKNPKGSKCQYALCRNCCVVKTSAEKIDCLGHHIFFTSRDPTWVKQSGRTPSATTNQ